MLGKTFKGMTDEMLAWQTTALLAREAARDAMTVHVRPELVSGPVPVDALPEDAITPHTAPLHFVFHTAFCCSTLLARALDVPGSSMGLKEPSVLVDFASVWLQRRQTQATETGDRSSQNPNPGSDRCDG
jgi:hypothetical protein